MPKTVYLSGPIRCVSDTDAFGWRDVACGYLNDKGFVVLYPTRRNAPPFDIVRQDLREIDSCDIVLAHVPNNIVAVGTNMEIFYASRKGRVVILWGGKFDKNMSPWLVAHGEAYCDTLQEALAFIWKNYSD